MFLPFNWRSSSGILRLAPVSLRTLPYNHFARTKQKTQPVYCWEKIFTAPLRRNGSYSFVAGVFVAAGICLLSRCLAINVYSDFVIPVFGRHVTILWDSRQDSVSCLLEDRSLPFWKEIPFTRMSKFLSLICWSTRVSANEGFFLHLRPWFLIAEEELFVENEVIWLLSVGLQRGRIFPLVARPKLGFSAFLRKICALPTTGRNDDRSVRRLFFIARMDCERLGEVLGFPSSVRNSKDFNIRICDSEGWCNISEEL
jgi:hypothetical protein